jgi:hypothetical protein
MKPDTETTWTPAEDLEWTAFRYIANELSAAETAAFEQQLADVQSAREAVARCVQLTHCVVAVEDVRACWPVVANRRPRRGWLAVALVAAAAVVCLAVWGGIQTWFPQDDAQDPAGQMADDNRKPAIGKPAVAPKNGGDPSAIIATWLSFDADWTGPDESSIWEEPAKLFSTTGPADGSFNWVIAAVDDAPLAVPTPEKSPKEPN